MLTQRLYLPRYDWTVTIYYAVTQYHIRDILSALAQIGCPDTYLRRSEENMLHNKVNNGITYSNNYLRRSVVVIGLADSPQQYANSIAHERAHLVTHIATAEGLSLQGEEICYLTGDLALMMYPISSKFICPSCFKHLRRRRR